MPAIGIVPMCVARSQRASAAFFPDARSSSARELRYFRTKYASLKEAFNSPELNRASAAIETAEQALTP